MLNLATARPWRRARNEVDRRAAPSGPICQSHGVVATLLLCRCDDMEEVERRFRARCGREAEPEHEAGDLSVFHDIARRWQDPWADRLADETTPPIMIYDTVRGRLTVMGVVTSPVVDLVREALALAPATRHSTHPSARLLKIGQA